MQAQLSLLPSFRPSLSNFPPVAQMFGFEWRLLIACHLLTRSHPTLQDPSFFLMYEHPWPTRFTHCLSLPLLQQEVCLGEWQATRRWDAVILVQFSPRSPGNLRNMSQIHKKHVHCRTQRVKTKSPLSRFLIYTLITSFDPSPQL